MRNLRKMRREEVEALVYKAVEDFSFGGYGMDDVDEVKGMDWHHALASEITDALDGED